MPAAVDMFEDANQKSEGASIAYSVLSCFSKI